MSRSWHHALCHNQDVLQAYESDKVWNNVYLKPEDGILIIEAGLYFVSQFILQKRLLLTMTNSTRKKYLAVDVETDTRKS